MFGLLLLIGLICTGPRWSFDTDTNCVISWSLGSRNQYLRVECSGGDQNTKEKLASSVLSAPAMGGCIFQIVLHLGLETVM